MSANPHVHPLMQAALDAACPVGLADTKLREGPSFIEYTSRGTLTQVLNVVRGVFRDFPAAGYSTCVRKIWQDGYGEADYVAEIWRARSCD